MLLYFYPDRSKIRRDEVRSFRDLECLWKEHEADVAAARIFRPPPVREYSVLPEFAYKSPTDKSNKKSDKEEIAAVDLNSTQTKPKSNSIGNGNSNNGSNNNQNKNEKYGCRGQYRDKNNANESNGKKNVSEGPSQITANIEASVISGESGDTEKQKSNSGAQCGIRNNSEILCYWCKKLGHYSRNCPDLICYGCEKQGSTRKRCPNCNPEKHAEN